MAIVKMYTKPTCPYCNAAKDLFEELGQEYEDVDVIQNPDERQRVSEENGDFPTVPMIFINDKFIGGHSDLLDLQESGELSELLGLDEHDSEDEMTDEDDDED